MRATSEFSTQESVATPLCGVSAAQSAKSMDAKPASNIRVNSCPFVVTLNFSSATIVWCADSTLRIHYRKFAAKSAPRTAQRTGV